MNDIHLISVRINLSNSLDRKGLKVPSIYQHLCVRSELLHGQKAPVDSITGMDCSADGVRKAQKRVTSALADQLQDQQLTEGTSMEKIGDICAPAGSLPFAKVQVMQGNIIDKADPGSSSFSMNSQIL